VHKRTFLTD